MNSFDSTVFHAINQFAGHTPVLDHIFFPIAQYGLEIYIVLFLIAWFTLPKADTDHRHALIVAGFAGILALVINLAFSHIWFRQRPFAVLPKGSFYQGIPHPADASFPSDHASGSFAFAAASWGTNSKWVSWVFSILAFTLMFARVYAGVHWPTDVLASFVIGTISGKLMWKFSPYLKPVTNACLRIFKYGPYSAKETRAF